jgi:hypothetical protein
MGRPTSDGRAIRRAGAILLVASLVLGVVSSAAAGDGVRRRGSCSGGPGEWELRVSREDARTLRVRFLIDDVDSGKTWQLFISDNGVRVYSGTKVARDGQVRVRRLIPDLAGTDRITASGVNADDGTTCGGRVSF